MTKALLISCGLGQVHRMVVDLTPGTERAVLQAAHDLFPNVTPTRCNGTREGA